MEGTVVTINKMLCWLFPSVVCHVLPAEAVHTNGGGSGGGRAGGGGGRRQNVVSQGRAMCG